jgi:hypothetical protein
VNRIHAVGDEWIENGHFAYFVACDKRCGCQGTVLLIGRVKNPRLHHMFDPAPGIPIETTHRVQWDDEDTNLRRAIF